MKKKVLASLVCALVALLAAGCGPELGTPTPDPRFPALQGYVGTPCNAQASPGLQGRMGFCNPPSATREVSPCPVGQLFCSGVVWVCADLPHGTACPVETIVHGPMDGGVDAGVPVDASPDVTPSADAGPVPTDTTPVADAGPPVDAGPVCENGVGACLRSGVWRVNQHGNRYCNAVPGTPSAEICDGIDNNCNGAIDDGITCACQIGAMRGCYTGPPNTRALGACRDGVQRCNGTAPTTWGSCDGQVLPIPEVAANGRDDNCNGRTDEPAPQ